MMINLRLGLTYVGFLYFLYLTAKKILRRILSKMGAITANGSKSKIRQLTLF